MARPSRWRPRLLVSVLLAACDAVAPLPPALVTITPAVVSLFPDDTARLTAIAQDGNGREVLGATVLWASSDSFSASVSASGLVTAHLAGLVVITASVGNMEGSSRISVRPAAASVVATPSRQIIVPGGSFTLTTLVRDYAGTLLLGRTLTWSSSDVAVATVDSTGHVTGNRAGSITVVAGTAGAQGTSQIFVKTPRFVQVEAGDGEQICGISADTLAYCWGPYDPGQFGIGSLSGFDSDTIPIGLTDSIRFTELHGGEGYTCGLAVGGAAFCWGFPANGRLGNGVGGGSFPSPVAVLGGHSFVSMGVGHSIGCGIKSDASMYCWGRNANGELGRDPALGPGLTPQLLTGGLTWRSVSPGTLTTCGITTDSAAYCWGLNNYGQVGSGDSTDQWAPVAVAGGHKFVSLSSASQHTCGVTDGGVAYCWGYNVTGALGDSSRLSSRIPVPVSGGLSFRQISAGGQHFGADFTCGVTTSDVAYCWGEGFYGNLGNNDVIAHDTPVPVSGGLTFSTVTAGFFDACGITTTGVTYCWGRTFGRVPLRIPGQP